MGKAENLFSRKAGIKIAQILTTVFSPLISALVGAIVLYQSYIYPNYGASIEWLTVVALIFVVSIVTFIYFLKSGNVSNWDISDRKQRPKVLLLIIIYNMVLVLATWQFKLYQALPFLIFFMFSLLLASLITLFWKVSFHTFSITLCMFFMLFTYKRIELIWLVLLPPIIAWTRIILKKHTNAQAIGGILLAILTVSFWELYRFMCGTIIVMIR